MHEQIGLRRRRAEDDLGLRADEPAGDLGGGVPQLGDLDAHAGEAQVLTTEDALAAQLLRQAKAVAAAEVLPAEPQLQGLNGHGLALAVGHDAHGHLFAVLQLERLGHVRADADLAAVAQRGAGGPGLQQNLARLRIVRLHDFEDGARGQAREQRRRHDHVGQAERRGVHPQHRPLVRRQWAPPEHRHGGVWTELRYGAYEYGLIR